MRLFGLIGYPLGHSFSKDYFTKKFEDERRADCRYELFPISQISKLPELLQHHPDLRGLNVTIPYKESVLEYLHDIGHLPQGLPACNCIKISDGKLYGYNTDCIGFEQALVPLLQDQHRSALVLGTGGAAKAVTFVLKKLNIPFKQVSRKANRDEVIQYSQLTYSMVHQHKLIVNTTPLGTYPAADEYPPIPYEALAEGHLLFDLVYNPATTAFMQRGLERGTAVINGWDMLVGQAEESWRIWNLS
jgi:shikimate dehydrogenase